ncbi:tRNA (guanosine(46)-N7)-methyltransferase TrmB [Acetobacteraceae bacterium H6797]|nr:tRNA (guanosine(46)-N7)-methyltransferase TrmB [Acetobacteraceae bacterium H6797]
MSEGPARPQIAEGIPNRLYGRRRSHPLRVRQAKLLDETLPRLDLGAGAANPAAAFDAPVDEVWLEVGFGGGEHSEGLLERNPGIGLIASEVFENGLCSLLSRLVPEGQEATAPLPGRLRLWPRDARHLLDQLPEGSLARLYLMFPDPWPKARHEKRRFVNPAIMPLVARVLRPGGEWRVATDDPTYQEWVRQCFGESPLFEQAAFDDTRPADWPATRYEAKAYREGRQPMWWVFRKR